MNSDPAPTTDKDTMPSPANPFKLSNSFWEIGDQSKPHILLCFPNDCGSAGVLVYIMLGETTTHGCDFFRRVSKHATQSVPRVFNPQRMEESRDGLSTVFSLEESCYFQSV